MVPTAFDEETDVLDIPGASSAEFNGNSSLSVCLAKLDTDDGSDQDLCISCWKMTPAELAEMTRTGRVWLIVYGNTMPVATSLSGTSPFEPHPDDSPEKGDPDASTTSS